VLAYKKNKKLIGARVVAAWEKSPSFLAQNQSDYAKWSLEFLRKVSRQKRFDGM
jgi:hypothetical protein